MSNVKDFIIDYIQREYTIADDIDVLKLNYVKEGYIDSIGMIQFIAIIEDEYNITFSEEELLSEELKTVGSLIELILSKMEDIEGE